MAKKETPSTTLNVDRDKYESTRSASGAKSLSNGDIVAKGLEGLELDEVFTVATDYLQPETDLEAKYKHLNIGMQRMNLGNIIRGHMAAVDAQCDKNVVDGKKAGPDGETVFNKIVAPFRKAADKRVAEAAKEKAAAAKAAADKKADAEKEKAARQAATAAKKATAAKAKPAKKATAKKAA